MTLEPNATLFIQIANFLLLLFLMNRLVYRPIRNILKARRERMTAFEASIAQFGTQASKNTEALEQGMVLARSEGFQERERCKSEGRDEERVILKQAGAAVEDKIAKARKDLESRMDEVRGLLERQTAVFSKELAEKILGRGVS